MRFRNRSENPSSGFTLIEVLISLVIIAGGLIVIYNVGAGNMLRIRKSRLNNNVATLLERKVTEIENRYEDASLTEIVDAEGNFGEDYPRYSWKFEAKEFQMPDMAPILIGQEGGANELLLTMIRQMQKWISASVKEGRVTVIVKAGKNTLEYSVTTYFIDYNKNLGLGGAAAAGGGVGR